MNFWPFSYPALYVSVKIYSVNRYRKNVQIETVVTGSLTRLMLLALNMHDETARFDPSVKLWCHEQRPKVLSRSDLICL